MVNRIHAFVTEHNAYENMFKGNASYCQGRLASVEAHFDNLHLIVHITMVCIKRLK